MLPSHIYSFFLCPSLKCPPWGLCPQIHVNFAVSCYVQIVTDSLPKHTRLLSYAGTLGPRYFHLVLPAIPYLSGFPYEGYYVPNPMLTSLTHTSSFNPSSSFVNKDLCFPCWGFSSEVEHSLGLFKLLGSISELSSHCLCLCLCLPQHTYIFLVLSVKTSNTRSF